ncbi:MAG: hypothetical protein AAF975_03025 [Spirochaetota bacterium]
MYLARNLVAEAEAEAKGREQALEELIGGRVKELLAVNPKIKYIEMAQDNISQFQSELEMAQKMFD